jgi:hypothetical protein
MKNAALASFAARVFEIFNLPPLKQPKDKRPL